MVDFGHYEGASKEYSNFLQKEYDNIASAHFSTVAAISSFFKHYLVLMGLFIPVGLAAFKMTEKSVTINIKTAFLIAGLASFVLSLVGFLVMCYVANLRFDAILYAQKVNAIRRYFSDRSNLSIFKLSEINHLPSSKGKPRYHEPYYFLFVILTIALINSCYFVGSLYLILRSEFLLNYPKYYPNWFFLFYVVLFVFLTVCLHYIFYLLLSLHRETSFFKTRIIGVDIDGVLNRHREHFCKIAKSKLGHVIDPKKINRPHVSDCEDNDLSREDEHSVFHDTKYWIDMPVDETAALYLPRIKEEFGFKVHVFSYRPWPIPGRIKSLKDKQEWKKVAFFRWKKKGKAISKITKKWLKANNFSYEKLEIETAHALVHGQGQINRYKNLVNNRFTLSQRREIELFVEDTFENAIKLAMYCDVVFLIDHPYNKQKELPHNVLRVTDWKDIYNHIKLLC